MYAYLPSVPAFLMRMRCPMHTCCFRFLTERVMSDEVQIHESNSSCKTSQRTSPWVQVLQEKKSGKLFTRVLNRKFVKWVVYVYYTPKFRKVYSYQVFTWFNFRNIMRSWYCSDSRWHPPGRATDSGLSSAASVLGLMFSSSFSSLENFFNSVSSTQSKAIRYIKEIK